MISYNRKSNKKPKSETFLVVKNASDGGGLLNTGNLIPGSGYTMGVGDGQIAFISTDPSNYGEILDPTVGGFDYKSPFRIVQGTPKSNDIRGIHPIDAIDDKAYIKSQIIDPKNQVGYAARGCERPKFNIWQVNSVDVPLAINEYALNLQFVSVRNDKWYGAHGEEDFTVNYTTPDYGVTTPASPLDQVLQNLSYQVNLNSAGLAFNNPASRRGNKNIIALAVDSTGASGGVTFDSVSAGVGVPVATDSSGNPVEVFFTADMVASLDEAVVNSGGSLVGATSTIVQVDLTTAGTLSVDNIVLMALDHRLAIARDDISQVKVRLRVGLEYINFVGTPYYKAQLVVPFEGQGSGRTMKLWYESRAGLNIYTAQNRHDGPQEYITPPSYIDTTKWYNVVIIEHNEDYRVSASHDVDWFHRLIILVECDDTNICSSGGGDTSLNNGFGGLLTGLDNSNTLEYSVLENTNDFPVGDEDLCA